MIPSEKGDVAVFDKAFTNFAWYATLLEKGIYFVARLRKNVDYRIVKRREVSHLKNIYSDRIIVFRSALTSHKCPYQRWHIRFEDKETGKIIFLLTN